MQVDGNPSMIEKQQLGEDWNNQHDNNGKSSERQKVNKWLTMQSDEKMCKAGVAQNASDEYDRSQMRAHNEKFRQNSDTDESLQSQDIVIYASGTTFFRWKMLRVRDLLRGFFSFSPLTFRPRARELRSPSFTYLSL